MPIIVNAFNRLFIGQIVITNTVYETVHFTLIGYNRIDKSSVQTLIISTRNSILTFRQRV